MTHHLTAFEKDFLHQAAIAAMQALIQARAVTEAAENRNALEYKLKGEPQNVDRYEVTVDNELFTHSIYSGVSTEIDLRNGDKTRNGVHVKYTWGELLAEEAFEVAYYMLAESRKNRNNLV
jgi:hypothetical protein